MTKNSTYLDTNTWIEEFCCQTHGTVWLKVSSQNNSTLKTSLATSNDWKRSTGTIDPRFPNPSVSEFSYSMSRKPKIKLNR